MVLERRFQAIVQPLLVAVMVGLVVLSFTALAHLLNPAWDAPYLPVFSGLAALLAFVTYRLYRYFHLYIYGGVQFRLAELAVLFITLQLVVDVWERHAPLQNGLPRIDVSAVIGYLAVVLCWQAATATAYDLDHLDELPERSRDYMPPIQRLAHRFFAGGFLIFAFAGITQLSTESALHLPHRAAGPVANVVLYFVLGMALFVQVRYETLRGKWQRAGAVVAPALPQRWLRYSLIFLALCGLAAGILPTQYTVGLLDLGRNVLDFFLYAAALLLLALGYITSLLASLLGSQHHPPNRPLHPLLPPPPPQTHPSRHGGADWIGLARSILFWLLTLTVGAYLLRAALQEYTPHLSAGPLARFVRWLYSFWRGTRDRVAAAVQLAARQLERARQQKVDVRPGLPRLGALSARDRVRFYYLSSLDRARAAGVPRRAAQTPLEYESSARPHLAEGAEPLQSLTGAFHQARYADSEVSPEAEAAARRDWKQLREALKKQRAGDSSRPR